MTYVFEPGQEVEVHHNCQVIGYTLLRGLRGKVHSVSDTFGEPIFRVNFAKGVLPMRAEEITLPDQPGPVDDPAESF